MRFFRRSNIRWIVTIGFMGAGFILLLLRLISLQVVSAGELSQRAERQREKGVSIEAERGTIYDRKGRILATNLDVPSLYAFPSRVENPNRTASRLARMLDLNPKSVSQLLNRRKSFVWVKRKLDPSLEREINRLEISGLGFIRESQRFYPKRQLLGQVLGFAGVDNQGLEGIELAFDSYLRGERGLVIFEQDAGGRPIFPKGLEYAPLSEGKDIVLTIDEIIQHIAERELDTVVRETQAVSGSVIVMNPGTGEILAMAIRPVFDPNRIQDQRPDQWRNRIITDTYEPGSTFKLVAAAAALEEKVATPSEIFFCENGAMRIGRRVIHDHLKHGDLTFAQVLQKSSNIGTAKIAMRLGDEVLYDYIRRFGFGEKTGIDLLGEVAGLVREPHRWTEPSLASIAMGQEISVTPIQLATAYAALANKGWLVRPYLVSEVRGSDGKVIAQFKPRVRRQVVGMETARQLMDILEGTVEEGGTAEKAAIKGYTVSGKTGTAQKVDPSTRRYSRNSFVASFVGIAPSEDPRIVVSVVVDSPKGKAWGGLVAGPVFKRITEQTLRYLEVPPHRVDQLLLAAQ